MPPLPLLLREVAISAFKLGLPGRTWCVIQHCLPDPARHTMLRPGDEPGEEAAWKILIRRSWLLLLPLLLPPAGRVVLLTVGRL